jgi:hypothetical protein
MYIRSSPRLAEVVILVLISAGLSSCAGVLITPRTVRESKGPEEDKEAAVAAWQEAVRLANEFLASPYRHTLPSGSFSLDDEGMHFVTPRGRWPIEVWWTPWGDFVLWTGGAAQEASYGFVVGKRPTPGRNPDRVLDNSFFRNGTGGLVQPWSMALMILHETTHIVYGVGTVGFWSSAVNYLEMIFLFRTSTNSAERRPRATGEEFMYFKFAKDAGDEPERRIAEDGFRKHMEKGGANCEHGPFSDRIHPPLPK